jgi:drug/metabolite transporter (DMT)-like permease
MNIKSAAPALLAALLFGASTPLAKRLGVDLSPLLLAGLLYAGSGIGLAIALAVRRVRRPAGGEGASSLSIPRRDLAWLCGAVAAGGVVGPVLLMTGLQSTDGASASLLLNVEGVLTALIAWVVFKENADGHMVAGMAAIVAGGVLLAWQPGNGQFAAGSLFIAGACLAWAIDNNLTRKVSANDAMLLACIKGLAAGACNTTLALAGGATIPAIGQLAATLAVGFAGYGLSLVLFVVALRNLGTARTGAYFSVAPLFGVLIAFVIWPEVPQWTFWPAAALMGVGVWLHLRERHGHIHSHELMEHEHAHLHDEHHQHGHDFAVGGEAHSHSHRHAPFTHQHAHYPDIHHRHSH